MTIGKDLLTSGKIDLRFNKIYSFVKRQTKGRFGNFTALLCLKNMNCPNCKKNLKETGIKLVEQNCEVNYDISLDSQGDIQYEQSDVGTGNGDAVICCGGCGAEVMTEFDEEEIKKILK